ncbi:MAG TPA: hypothetical protein VED17_11105 [Nitrososphaerales archaeon]|nr:hypothetical protein [Nitrososphaerales archaeon]
MLGQLCVLPELLAEPDVVLPEDVVLVVVVVAAKEANPYAMKAPTAKIATIAISSIDFLLGKDLVFGTGVVPISIFSLHLRRCWE